MIGLTRKQAQARDYILAENAQGRWPTVRQVAAAIGSVSSSTGFHIISKLMERGHVYRFLTPAQARNKSAGRLIAIQRPA